MIYDDITAYLSGEYRKGKTWQQIGEEHGLSFSYVRDLAQRRRRVEGITLETFFKLFPSAQISLSGASFEVAPDSSLRHEREKLDLERALLAAERRELEQTRKNLELEKENLELRARSLLSTPRAPHAAEPVAPYRVEPSILSPSTK